MKQIMLLGLIILGILAFDAFPVGAEGQMASHPLSSSNAGIYNHSHTYANTHNRRSTHNRITRNHFPICWRVQSDFEYCMFGVLIYPAGDWRIEVKP